MLINIYLIKWPSIVIHCRFNDWGRWDIAFIGYCTWKWKDKGNTKNTTTTTTTSLFSITIFEQLVLPVQIKKRRRLQRSYRYNRMGLLLCFFRLSSAWKTKVAVSLQMYESVLLKRKHILSLVFWFVNNVFRHSF